MPDWLLSSALNVAMLAVWAGVALEGPETVRELKRTGWKKLRCFKKLEIMGFAMLVAGLAAEWRFSQIISSRENTKIGAQQATISKQQKQIIGLQTELLKLSQPRQFDTKALAKALADVDRSTVVRFWYGPGNDSPEVAARLVGAFMEIGWQSPH